MTRKSNMPPNRSGTSSPLRSIAWALYLIIILSFAMCPAYCNSRSGATGDVDVDSGKPCTGTIHLRGDSSSSLTLIRDLRRAFYTDNSNSQYHAVSSRNFGLVARDICMIVFGVSIWRVETCLEKKDIEANGRCIQLANRLAQRTDLDQSRLAQLWNEAFESLGNPRARYRLPPVSRV